MQFHEIFALGRKDLEQLLDSGNDQAIIDALLSAAYNDADWRWVQETCLRFLDHREASIRQTAATCLGHVARIHRQLDVDVVLPRLYSLQADPTISVEDAIEDIQIFVRPH